MRYRAKGQSLARYIRHQYPIALIDESQDINTEQALLIQRVYLQDFGQIQQTKQKNQIKISYPLAVFAVGRGSNRQFMDFAAGTYKTTPR